MQVTYSMSKNEDLSDRYVFNLPYPISSKCFKGLDLMNPFICSLRGFNGVIHLLVIDKVMSGDAVKYAQQILSKALENVEKLKKIEAMKSKAVIEGEIILERVI